MIHLTYFPSTNNPLGSGHIFWEIFTTFIFAHFLNAIPIWNNTWNNTSIIPRSTFKKYTGTELSSYDYILTINQYKEWASLSFQQFTTILNQITELQKQHNNILVRFSNVCSIHPDALCMWYSQNKIETDVFSLNIQPLLRQLYYDDHEQEPLDIFAIHIRRGDLAKWSTDQGFTMDYYTKIINVINKYMNIKINIYCESGNTSRGNLKYDKLNENFDFNDVLILKNLKNVSLIMGNPLGDDFNEHFNQLCRSKYIFMSPSSFPLWCGFISNATIFVDTKCVECRPNLFNKMKYVPNCSIFDDFDETILKLTS